MGKLLVKNIGKLVTLQKLVEDKRHIRITAEDLSVLPDAWMAIEGGKIIAYASGEPPSEYKDWEFVDADGRMVTPGLVDSHTHPVFGGDRTHEFAARLTGKTYQDIAAAGGGIKYSITATREAMSSDLLERCQDLFETFLKHGVTTVEAKTGYGQNAREEIRSLEVLQEARHQSPQTISITCLGLHDLPKDFASKTDYIRHITDELLPVVAQRKLADWVDAFVERGYFEVDDVKPYFDKAKELGLKIRMHADEFQESGAANAAAFYQAASADHMQKASDEGIRALAESGGVAVMLPGTSFYTKIPYADAKRFRDQNCPVAIASDFNPGSCYLSNLPFVASLAALYCGLSPYEAFVGVSWNGAKALQLESRKGALAVGYDADFVIHRLRSIEQWIADFGQTHPSAVYCAGKLADSVRYT
ncbi:MAG: imidazolonepropionase [Proteobacteria bacterium]|nr:MAG: imidazolonepropionase [Pseudomonadota bacterium]